jgi:hypothetical protein
MRPEDTAFCEPAYPPDDLRDYFAAKAMAAYVSSYPQGEISDAGDIAFDSYAMADAMLAERNK